MDGNILANILAVKDQLTKKEQKLAQFILNSPNQVIDLSIHELAKQSDVSAATIVRFCKSLGLEGYGKLRLSLSSIQVQDKNNSYQEISPGEDVTTIADKMATHFETVINATRANIKDSDIKQAIDWLGQADRIEVFGIGAAAIVAKDFYQKMMRVGRAINYFDNLHLALTEMTMLNDGATIVAISNSGRTYEVVELLKAAKKINKNLHIILITSVENSPASEFADLILINQDLGESKIRLGATTSLISQLFIIDILLFTYVATYTQEIIPKINLSKKLLDKYKI